MTDTYQMSTDDFPNGCLVVTDALTGRQIASGTNILGMKVVVPLNVELCCSCDTPVEGGCLCERIEVDLRRTIEMQKPRRAA